MLQAFIGRQPIFNEKLEVVAYEILYRDSEENRADFQDGDVASVQCIFSALMDFGLDRLVGPHTAFINLPGSLIVGSGPPALPKERVVLEILESSHVDEALIQAVQELVDDGYRIALDDFVYHEAWEPLIECAQIVKLDVLALQGDVLAQHVELLKRFDVQILAEKIETRDEFERLRRMGFERFQGFFLSRPEVLTTARISSNRLAVLRLLSDLSAEENDAGRIEELITNDVSLSYRLLRYINSAYFSLAHEIESIGQSLVLLGLTRVRQWAMLLCLSDMSDKPRELMITAMVRARMCQLLAEATELPRPYGMFTVGLFSVLDVLMDRPMEQVLEKLPLTDEITAALLTHEGGAGRMLDCALAYERGDWDRAQLDGVSRATLRDAYMEAAVWADEVGAALGTGA